MTNKAIAIPVSKVHNVETPTKFTKYREETTYLERYASLAAQVGLHRAEWMRSILHAVADALEAGEIQQATDGISLLFKKEQP